MHSLFQRFKYDLNVYLKSPRRLCDDVAGHVARERHGRPRALKSAVAGRSDHKASLCVSGWPRHVRAYGGWLGMEEPMKDVAVCDKPRGGDKQPLIRGCPNGETPVDEVDRRCTEYIGTCEGTWGSETSQYPEEKKTNKR